MHKFYAIRPLFGMVLLAAMNACGGATPPPPPPPPAAPIESATPAPVTSARVAPVASADPKPKQPPHWTYEGAEGPAEWGTLWPDWEKCKTGVEQSPIDLPKTGEKPAKPVPLAISYGKFPLQILNNGHTVQVPAAPGGKLTVDAVEYDLQQFHLHAPSEHTIAGSKFDGELHLVHKNSNGDLSVVGILLKKGKENRILAPVFAAAPEKESHEATLVSDASVDLSKLVPAKAAYYSYQGSLTTPPCSEHVQWFVLTTPVEISEAQLEKFKASMHGENARPTLPLGSRHVVAAHL